MSMRDYGIYHQGAIIHQEDFDPIKVITVYIEKALAITVPDCIKEALACNDFNAIAVLDLCNLLCISEYDRNSIKSYSDISNNLLADAERDEWFEWPNPLMGTKMVPVCVFSDIEGKFIADNDSDGYEDVCECFMFSLNFPLAWRVDEYTGPRSRDEAVALIREAAKPLLKDGIDWDARLGALIGSSCG